MENIAAGKGRPGVLSAHINLSLGVALKQLNKDLLLQLICNVVNNAIRYNKPNGQIIIRDSFSPDKSYCLIIEDSRIGIAEKDLPFIF